MTHDDMTKKQFDAYDVLFFALLITEKCFSEEHIAELIQAIHTHLPLTPGEPS